MIVHRESKHYFFRVKENSLLQFSLHNELVLPHVCHLIQALVDFTARENAILSACTQMFFKFSKSNVKYIEPE